MKPITNVILLLLCLTGCSPSPSEDYNTYIKRLHNTLDFPAEPRNDIQAIKINLPPFATQNTNQFNILELAKINQCHLSQLIAQHNNQLGKTALPSLQLKYQIEFLKHSESCQNQLQDQEKIVNILAKVSLQKRQTIYAQFKHFLLTEAETKSLFTLSSQELINEEAAGLSDTLSALAILKEWDQALKLADVEHTNTDDLMLALTLLKQTQFSAKLILSMQKQIALNQQLTASLSNIDLAQFCPLGKSNPKVAIFSNIFTRFYLQNLQGYQAQLIGQFQQLKPYLSLLWHDENGHLIAAELSHIIGNSEITNLQSQLSLSAKKHVQWWQQFYQICKIAPK
ncbi:DUF3080 family protein [Pseudoalteromonas tunicata]|uniref:Orphan protein n=1 Tax=Pseudoalteromonas tunicata D2 TaxID=87626 RepID=A4C9V1_9GAMM|nr:DUF3080 family protein [Pseudoalteromonas tunicata]AXT30421.1 DUF3080 family protein [Pseudoalteromonas tunicata]EAR28159.1 hypothetical protein PTD2_20127 [Pseudoalteromonas tunicata D2]